MKLSTADEHFMILLSRLLDYRIVRTSIYDYIKSSRCMYWKEIILNRTKEKVTVMINIKF